MGAKGPPVAGNRITSGVGRQKQSRFANLVIGKIPAIKSRENIASFETDFGGCETDVSVIRIGFAAPSRSASPPRSVCSSPTSLLRRPGQKIIGIRSPNFRC